MPSDSTQSGKDTWLHTLREMFDADREHDFSEIVQDADGMHVRTLDDMEIEISRNDTRWIARMYSPDRKYREVRGTKAPNPPDEDAKRFFRTIVEEIEHADKWKDTWETRPTRKRKNEDGRHDPPQTVAIILTLLPLAIIAIAYICIATPFPHWLASLPWRTVIQTLPWFFAISACAPLGYLAAYAYRALAHWRLTVGETLRAGIAAMVGTTHCVLTAVAFLNSNCAGRPLPARLTVVAAFITAMLIVVCMLAYDEYWPWRLLFPKHERLSERLAQYTDTEVSVGYYWSYRDFGGLSLPIPLDVLPEWFDFHLSDLEEYAAYHPQLRGALEDAKKRIEKHRDTDAE